MRKYGFLTSSRWLGLIAFALIASVVCVFLGMWQWGRYEDKKARLERVDANWNAPAITIDDALARGLTVTEPDEFRLVDVTGEYVPGSDLLLRSRTVGGRVVAQHAALLEVDRPAGDVVVLVHRGWTEVESEAPPLPAGTQDLALRLRLEESASTRTPPEGQLFHLNATDAAALAGLDAGSALLLRGWAEAVPVEAGLGELPEPARDLGNHLSYAFQWWFFAGAIPVGLVVLARREAMDDLAMAVAGIGAPRRAAPRDEDIEDQLITQQTDA